MIVDIQGDGQDNTARYRGQAIESYLAGLGRSASMVSGGYELEVDTRSEAEEIRDNLLSVFPKLDVEIPDEIS